MSAQERLLIEAAITASQHAYIRYSNYRVGAALRAVNGLIYHGCNIENASYPVTICAERVALAKAVSDGVREFDAIAVVTANGASPCGMCRQMLFEFAPQLQVLIADFYGTLHHKLPLSDLLFLGFGPTHLEK
ncbi:MAG: cytidine deaminase [Chloroflexi bacterium]|nr:cytidine deaminase [Chloroflexota bacterium]